MKQVIFAITLIAMVSLTGCLGFGEEEGTDGDSLINPTDAYSPPQFSTIMVDSGTNGYWDCENNNNNSCVYIPCTKQGYQDLNGDGNAYEYCDIDGHYNDGPQVIIKKMGNQISIECIKNYENNYCRNYDEYTFTFRSIEGLEERIYCRMIFDEWNNNERFVYFNTCQATLGFEPVSVFAGDERVF